MTIPLFALATAFRPARIIGLLLAALMLAGCSAIKLGYNNLPELSYWWLDGYVDFSDSQAPRVREGLGRLHRWHRGTELPKYVQLLQQAEQLAGGDLGAAQACSMVADIRERLALTASQGEPAIAALALDLSPEQLRHIERKYEKGNADYRDNWLALPPAEQKEKRFKEMVERSEMIYARLEEPQRALLRAHIERSVFDARLVLAERQRRQQDALQTLHRLAGRPVPPERAVRLVHEFMERAQQPPIPVLRQHQEALLRETCESLSALHNSTSAAQRDTAVRRLRAYQRDLRELAGQR